MIWNLAYVLGGPAFGRSSVINPDISKEGVRCMTKEELYYNSRDGIHKIHAVRYIPDGEIRYIVQIIHGMEEHIGRYEEFAVFLCEHGILVSGNDHLGHGKSINSDEELGYFCDKDQLTVVVRDIHRLKKMNQEKYPQIKTFILGHSMGALILQNYLLHYSTGIDGCIICGTASHNNIEVLGGKILLRLLALFGGWHRKSKFAEGIVNGNANARIDNPRTPSDWLCHDEMIVDKFVADPRCGFTFSINGLYLLIDALGHINNKKQRENIDKNLSIRFISGTQDPVGNYTKGVNRAFSQYKDARIVNLDLILYDGMRHEVLNEVGRGKVYRDVLEYFDKLNL